jgi:hypothetical protein
MSGITDARLDFVVANRTSALRVDPTKAKAGGCTSYYLIITGFLACVVIIVGDYVAKRARKALPPDGREKDGSFVWTIHLGKTLIAFGSLALIFCVVMAVLRAWWPPLYNVFWSRTGQHVVDACFAGKAGKAGSNTISKSDDVHRHVMLRTKEFGTLIFDISEARPDFPVCRLSLSLPPLFVCRGS